MREILTSTPSVVVAITGFVVCLALVLLDRRAEARQRERQQRLQEELLVLGHESVTAWIKKCRKNLHRAYIKKKAALDAATSKTATGGISTAPIHTSSIHQKEELSSDH